MYCYRYFCNLYVGVDCDIYVTHVIIIILYCDINELYACLLTRLIKIIKENIIIVVTFFCQKKCLMHSKRLSSIPNTVWLR